VSLRQLVIFNKMDFFEKQKEQSHIKSEIVKKYFWAWGKIIGCRAPNVSIPKTPTS
jgi:hypothetical protein